MRIILFLLLLAVIPLSLAATRSCVGGTNTGTLINCSGSTGRAQINISADTVLTGATCVLTCNISSPKNFTLLNNNIKWNCSGNTKCGITLAASTYANFKMGGNTWSSLNGNNTWILAPFDAYKNDTNVNVIIENNTFSGLGEWPGTTDYTKGIYLKSCGNLSRIRNNNVYNSSHFVYIAAGAIGGGSSACIVNISKNRAYLIRHTFVTCTDGIKSECYVDGNNVTGIYNITGGSMNNNAGMFHYSSNTRGMVIKNNRHTGGGYVTDFVGGDKNCRLSNNVWRNSRMGDMFDDNISNCIITNSYYYNISDAAVYFHQDSGNNTLSNLYVYNVTGSGQGYCIWLAAGDKPADAPRNMTFTNIKCLRVNQCIRNANGTNITYSKINCTDVLGTNAASFDLGTKNVLLTKSNFTRAAGYSINLGAGVNMTINATNLFDWNVTSASALVKWSANYYANDTTPDADGNGIVDHTHVIPGLGGDFDLVPRAHYYGYTSPSTPSTPPSTDPHLDSLCTKGFGGLIFLVVFIMALAGAAAIAVLTKGTIDAPALIMVAGAGILIVITLGVVVAQICTG